MCILLITGFEQKRPNPWRHWQNVVSEDCFLTLYQISEGNGHLFALIIKIVRESLPTVNISYLKKTTSEHMHLPTNKSTNTLQFTEGYRCS